MDRDFHGIFGTSLVVDEKVVEKLPTIYALNDLIGVKEASDLMFSSTLLSFSTPMGSNTSLFTIEGVPKIPR